MTITLQSRMLWIQEKLTVEIDFVIRIKPIFDEFMTQVSDDRNQ